MKYLLPFYFFCIPVFLFSQSGTIDSLKNFLTSSVAEDTNRVNTLNDLAWKLFNTSNYTEAKTYSDEALAISEKLIFKKGSSKAYNTIGVVFLNQGNYPEALKYELQALKIREEMGDKKGAGNLYNNIGLIYSYQNNYTEALKNYAVSLKIKKESNDKFGLANVYNDLAIMYENQNRSNKALENFLAAEKLFEGLGDKQGIATSCNNIGHVYEKQGNYSEALKEYFFALNIQKEIKEKDGIVISFINIGESYLRVKKFPEAHSYLNKALNLSEEIGSKERMKDVYEVLTELDSASANFQSAYHNYKIFVAYRDSILNQENTEKIVKTQMNYEFDKKETIRKAEQEKQGAVAAAESRRQKMLIYFISAVALAAVVLAFNIFRGYKQKQKANKLLKEKNSEIEKQKKLVETKNKDILDSINYAQCIQEALLIPEEELRKYFTDVFVLFKPKDIVSGDFYWFAESEFNTILAAADCTGHGVPGGFMSMLGFEMLQEILLLEEVKTTAEAFITLDKKITETLNRNNRSHRDGMDMALCAFSKSSNKLQFSCANRPLILVRRGEVKEFLPDKFPLGGGIDNIEKKFRNQEIETEKDDMIYLFSDGYADQFGGLRQKKFMYKKLLKTLLDISHHSLGEQKQMLEETFNNWKGNLEQVDDVLVIGIRI